MTRAPGSTWSVTTACSDLADPSAATPSAPGHTPVVRCAQPRCPRGLSCLWRARRAACRWFPTVDVGFVDLRRAGQPGPARTHQHRSQPMQHRPRGRIRTDLQRTLKTQRGQAVLLRGEHPAGLEPHRQRRPTTIEHRARRDRCPRMARRAPVPTIGDRPAADVPAARAHEAVRPAQPVQIVQAVRVGSEPRPEVAGDLG